MAFDSDIARNDANTITSAGVCGVGIEQVEKMPAQLQQQRLLSKCEYKHRELSVFDSTFILKLRYQYVQALITTTFCFGLFFQKRESLANEMLSETSNLLTRTNQLIHFSNDITKIWVNSQTPQKNQENEVTAAEVSSFPASEA